MTDDEIIQTYLKHMVKIGSIKFGWYEDITTYTYLRSSISTKYHPDSGEVIINHLANLRISILNSN